MITQSRPGSENRTLLPSTSTARFPYPIARRLAMFGSYCRSALRAESLYRRSSLRAESLYRRSALRAESLYRRSALRAESVHRRSALRAESVREMRSRQSTLRAERNDGESVFRNLSRGGAVRMLLWMFLIPLPLGILQTADAQEQTAPPLSSLNATDAELEGVLSPADRARAARNWEKEIAGLERLDQTQSDPDNAIMLLGSSSIRLWDSAADLLAPYPIIRRGYGGARYSDLVVFAKRLTSPHRYRALVVFVANDITGSKNDRSVEEVRKMVLHVVEVSHQHQADAPVLLVEVTPTPSRWKVWQEIRELNAMMREIALTHPGVFFVSTAEYYLDGHDEARPELFRKDQLHQNEDGYQIWAEIIRRRLDEVLGEETSSGSASKPEVSRTRVNAR